MSTVRELKTQLVIPFADVRAKPAPKARRGGNRDEKFSPVLLNFGMTALLLVAFVGASAISLVIGRALDPADDVSLGTVLATIGGGLIAIVLAIRALGTLVDRYEGVSVTGGPIR
jgi:hypothetical protein